MQKALDDLVRHYIISETRYEKAEKEDGPLEDNVNQEAFEDEYIKALYDCLENKGVVQELQTFLRQRLVSILQDKWPKLGGQDELVSFNPVAVRLVQDFLCSHQLLYTFSVLASEIGQIFSLKQPFGKVPLPEAERILDQMEIRKIGSSRERILQCYLEKDRFSLLECIICICPWAWQSDGVLKQEKRDKNFSKPQIENSLHLRKTLDGIKKNINEESKEDPCDKGVKERLKILEENMKKEQESYSVAVSRYKEEDAKRIYDEIESRLKFEMLAKEKELLQNYEEKAISMRKALDRERELWLCQKDREENDLFQHKERIKLLMNSLNEKQQIVKSLLENYQSQCTTEENEIRQKERNYILKEAELNGTILKLREENKILKNMQTVKREQVIVPECQSKEQITNTNKVNMAASPSLPSYDTNNDTIAFLKYSLECQAEEIKLLRSSFVNSQSRSQSDGLHQEEKGITSRNSGQVKHAESREVREKHLEQFIKDSKRRCDEIEKEAKEIESSLESLKNKSMEKTSRISRSPMISSQGRLNLLPSVPKIDTTLYSSLLTPNALPHPLDETTYFTNLLQQMFPSRDYNLPRRQTQNSQTGTGTSNTIPTEFVRFHESSKTQERVKDNFKSATIDEDMIFQFQENLSDLKKLATTRNSPPAARKGSLKAILENGEIPNDSVQVATFTPNKSTSLNNTRLAKNSTSFHHSLESPEDSLHSLAEYAGGDAKIFANPERAKNKKFNGNTSQAVNRSEHINNIQAKASESGALIKAKVQSPSDNNKDNGDRSEASISIRSVMKTKVNLSEKDNIIRSQTKEIRQEEDNDDDLNYVTEDNSEDDLSISAPDSISQADDFWNV